MGLFRNVINILAGGTTRNEGIQTGMPNNYSTPSAVPVTQDSALQLSAVWACVRILSESIGSLPINVYKLSDGGVKTPYKDHALSRLMRHKPNKFQTRQEYMESLVYQFVLQGNDFSSIARDSKGQLISLMPLMSPQMTVDFKDNDLIYDYQTSRQRTKYKREEIWHNKLYGNGLIGLSPLGHARNTIGVGQAAELATTNIYRNGGKPSGLLKMDKFLTPDQREKARANFTEITSGSQERLFVLEGGMDWESVSLSPQDIELLNSRKFQIEDICRFFGVPSVLVNDTSASTSWGSGIQQIIEGFYKFGLRPYLERYEASMKANLLNAMERDTMDIEFDFNALLRPDLSDRIKSYGEGVQKGIMTSNQARKLEGWESLPGGDSLMMQQQMAPMEILKYIDRKGMTNESKKEK